MRDITLSDNWLDTVTNFFELRPVHEHHRLEYMSQLLKDEALLWYRMNLPTWKSNDQANWTVVKMP